MLPGPKFAVVARAYGSTSWLLMAWRCVVWLSLGTGAARARGPASYFRVGSISSVAVPRTWEPSPRFLCACLASSTICCLSYARYTLFEGRIFDTTGWLAVGGWEYELGCVLIRKDVSVLVMRSLRSRKWLFISDESFVIAFSASESRNRGVARGALDCSALRTSPLLLSSRDLSFVFVLLTNWSYSGLRTWFAECLLLVCYLKIARAGNVSSVVPDWSAYVLGVI